MRTLVGKNVLSHHLRSPSPGPPAPGGGAETATEVGQFVSTNLWRDGVSRRALSAPARLLGFDADPETLHGGRVPPLVQITPPC